MKKDELIAFARIIGEPTRLQILSFLKKECCVGEIWKKLDLQQNLVSHHLRVLRDAGLVVAEKKGKRMIYCLNKDNMDRNLKKLINYLS